MQADWSRSAVSSSAARPASAGPPRIASWKRAPASSSAGLPDERCGADAARLAGFVACDATRPEEVDRLFAQTTACPRRTGRAVSCRRQQRPAPRRRAAARMHRRRLARDARRQPDEHVPDQPGRRPPVPGPEDVRRRAEHGQRPGPCACAAPLRHLRLRCRQGRRHRPERATPPPATPPMASAFNVLAPGLIDTPMAARAVADPAIVEYLRRKQPLAGGPGRPEDCADAAVFLCSDAARLITGVVLPVDGGWCVSDRPVATSFPRSAWERTSGRSASRLTSGADGTQSVPGVVPTRSVGTRRKCWKRSFPPLKNWPPAAPPGGPAALRLRHRVRRRRHLSPASVSRPGGGAGSSLPHRPALDRPARRLLAAGRGPGRRRRRPRRP